VKRGKNIIQKPEAKSQGLTEQEEVWGEIVFNGEAAGPSAGRGRALLYSQKFDCVKENTPGDKSKHARRFKSKRLCLGSYFLYK